MAKKKTDHVIIRNQKLFCSHCGREQVVPYPIEIPVFVAMGNAFSKSHANCLKTWKEPEADLNDSIIIRAALWVQNGEHGTSSKCMYGHLSGDFKSLGLYKEHPCDPDDFRRCYKLLVMIPEWKAKLISNIKPISPVWGNLVDNWDKLTEMLEEQMITKKANGMYEFMKTLGC